MYQTLRLQQFRSYKDYSLQLSPGVNIIVGPNASGKTNLLEAIYLTSRLKTFRGQLKGSIQDGKDWFRVDAQLEDQSRTVKLQPPKQLELLVNDSVVKRAERWPKQIPVVLFEPDDLRFLKGSPARRRSYVDEVLAKTNAQYQAKLARYNKALLQRNALLKEDHVDRDELFIWDMQLAENGAIITRGRNDFVKTLNDKLSSLYSHIAGKNFKVTARYQKSSSVDQSNSLKVLHRSLSRDRALGFTSSGPHRDDLTFTLGKTDAHSHASRGETRSLVLALKMVEEELVAKTFQTRPVMLLDDVFSELDAARRRHVTEYFKDHQVVITTTDADAVIEHFTGGAYEIIPLKAN